MAVTAFSSIVLSSVLAFVSHGGYIASLITTEWMSVTILSLPKKYYGLFKACFNGSCFDINHSDIWPNHSDDINAVRALIFLALLSLFIGLAVTVILILRTKNQRPRSASSSRKFVNWHFLIGCISFISSFVFSMTAIGVFREAIFEDVETSESVFILLGYSFYLCAFAGVCAEFSFNALLYGSYKSY